MNTEPTWIDLAHQIEKLKAVQPLWAEWLAYVGSQDYGLWFLRPDSQKSDDARATFSLTAAQIISKLKLPPVPVPKPLQYCPHWELSCKTEEEMALKEGKVLDLSDAVPHGLDKVDFDAVDPCTRALLEFLRRESRAFQISTTGTDWIRGIAYPTVTGEIKDLCGTVASFCKRRARDEIGAQLRPASQLVESKVQERRDESESRVKYRSVDLLERIVVTRNITIEGWATQHNFGRSTVFDWKAARLAGHPLKAKVSEPTAAAIERAIETEAAELGLSTRTDSD